jgi:rhodanese-related sulfurtransferase
MGRVAGDNVCNGDTIFGPVAGATILKCFDMTIGSVGLTSADCLEKGYEIECCWGTFYDRMHYYPEAAPVHLKLIADRGSDRVLGIQILSNGNILHLLDVAAQAIRTGATVDELQDLEHAYTPPFGQPFSPLHYLSFILENSRSAGIAMVSPSDFFTLPAETLLLDVRDDNERAKSPLENSELPTISIPLEQLRSRLIEIPSDRPTVAVCQMGGRAWDAALMLRRTGRKDLSFLAGGLLMLPHRKSGVKLNETGS